MKRIWLILMLMVMTISFGFGEVPSTGMYHLISDLRIRGGGSIPKYAIWVNIYSDNNLIAYAEDSNKNGQMETDEIELYPFTIFNDSLIWDDDIITQFKFWYSPESGYYFLKIAIEDIIIMGAFEKLK